MYLTAHQIQDMNEEKLRSFLDRGFQEGRYLDYKESYEKPSSYEGKKEFLKDVTGMANAGGGTIIIGVKESPEGDGLPGEVIGIDDGENQAQRWENITKDCIDPRIPGIFAWVIPLSTGKSIVIIYVPPSFRKPHMVNIEKHRSFYIRHNRDTVPMSVDEIRHAVLSVEGAPDKAHAYLLARELDIRQTKMLNPCPLLLQAIPIIPLESDIDPLSEPIKQILYGNDDRLKVNGYTLKSNFLPYPTLWGVESGSGRDNPDYLVEIHRTGYI